MSEVWVLTRTIRYDDDSDTIVVAAYDSYEKVLARIDKIDKANPPYKMTAYGDQGPDGGPTMWIIGPDHDEGFFGNSPRTFRATRKEVL